MSVRVICIVLGALLGLCLGVLLSGIIAAQFFPVGHAGSLPFSTMVLAVPPTAMTIVGAIVGWSISRVRKTKIRSGARRSVDRAASGRCVGCGHDMRVLPTGSQCPKCGRLDAVKLVVDARPRNALSETFIGVAIVCFVGAVIGWIVAFVDEPAAARGLGAAPGLLSIAVFVGWETAFGTLWMTPLGHWAMRHRRLDMCLVVVFSTMTMARIGSWAWNEPGPYGGGKDDLDFFANHTQALLASSVVAMFVLLMIKMSPPALFADRAGRGSPSDEFPNASPVKAPRPPADPS
jgi:hypothetical protein